ncbi:hydrogenase, partial [Trichloromonas sp.]|uniref:hydrogenase large subunit n=1 Tax=Trichloromonas sp. TaxID=3069249 RepID=UPI003D817B2F
YALIARDRQGDLVLLQTKIGAHFASLTPRCTQLHLFEREIAEQYGAGPEGHPWLKPVRFHRSWRAGQDAWERDTKSHPVPGDMPFYRVEGEEVHEVAVGPVHAGVIEPGHFRFQCHGEEVLHLEISLGYQHRAIEQQLIGGPHPRTPFQMETAAGDTSIGHMTAWCQVNEALGGVSAPARGDRLRAVALELERLANHVGDLGAIAGDVGFLPTASYCGRLRGDYLNLTAELCGSRFGRGLVRPGGTAFDCPPELAERLLQRLEPVARNTRGAIDLMFETPSVLARLEGAGRLRVETALELGLVGVAARACDLQRDVRLNHPVGVWRDSFGPVPREESGDVFARACIRRREIHASLDWVRKQLKELPGGPHRTEVPALLPDRLAVSLVEGWRGEIIHVALTDARGRLSRYKIVDPSFHNWSGLAMALRAEQISDFPLCNKSFNLSYCGFDL